MAEPEGNDLLDLDQFRLPPEQVGSLVGRGRPPRHRYGESFLRGPIPYVWVASACRLPGVGLHVALVVRFLRDRFRRGRDRRWTLEAIASGLRVSVKSVRRGLDQAERAGLLSVSREPGRKILMADVTILELAETDTDRRPLYGPVPWAWLLPALRLRGPALRVALACWLWAGWSRSAEVELVLGEWVELGLTRQAAGRGLASLERAGLVGVRRRPGGSPFVTLFGESGRPPSGAGPSRSGVEVGV